MTALTRTGAAPWATAVCAIGLVAGCNFVGEGDGQAFGDLFISWCNKNGDYGTPTQKKRFDLNLDSGFFGGEPIEDPSGRFRFNRLIIRLQRSGKRAEVNDVLTFDIQNSYEVARCVRGRTVGGVPDWDTDNCFRTEGQSPRMRVAGDAYINAYFTPRSTCSRRATSPPNLVVGEAVSSIIDERNPMGRRPGEWESWIALNEFGAAQKPGTSPEQRSPVPRTFKVDFGQTVSAPAFHVQLSDQRSIRQRRADDEPAPTPEIGGYLAGWFVFDLERGQGAQTFP